jgi:hypothetical protein
VASIITFDDLPAAMQSAELVDVMLAGANARAARVAPCLVATDPAPTEDQLAEAKLVLIGAIGRWVQAGTGAFQTETVGPFGVSVDTRQRSGYNLWPSEITGLQDICKNGELSGAFDIDTVGCSTIHAEICALNFGALYCSCGADIAGFPLYEVDC